MSTFASNVIKLVSGNLFAQIIAIVMVPLITRLYSPTDFGFFQLFLSIATMISVISCLAYQLAIMLPKEDEDAAAIVVLCFILITITAVTTGIFFIMFSEGIGKILNAPGLSRYFIFLPIAVFLSGSLLVMNYWASRKKQFGVTAASQVVNALSSKSIQISVGIFSGTPLGLIGGLIVGNFSSFMVFSRLIKKNISDFKGVTATRIRNLAERYKRFPMFTTWSNLANNISNQMAPLILVFFFTPAVVGYYALANIVVVMPLSLIGSATSQVFFQKACEERNRTGSVKSIVEEVHRRLLSIGMFPMIILMIIGTDIFTLFLGSQWYTAGEYAGILAPWQLIAFFTAPLIIVFSVLEMQTVDLTYNLLILVCRTVVLVIGGLTGNPVVAIILFSLTGVVFSGSMNLYILKVSGIPYRNALKDYLKYLLLCIILVIPLIIVKLLLMPVSIILVVTGIVSCAYYAIIVWTDSVLKNEALGIVHQFRR